MAPRARKGDAELLAELVRRLTGFEPRAGVVRGELAGEGLVATVEVKVARVVEAAHAAELLAAALELAERELFRVGRCAAPMPKRSKFGCSSECSKPVTTVVVRAGAYDLRARRPHHFSFQCTAHARQFRPDVQEIVAVLALPKAKLDGLRARYEREREAGRRADDEHDRALEAAAAAARSQK